MATTKSYTSVEDFSHAAPGQHVHCQNTKTGSSFTEDSHSIREQRNIFLIPSGMALPSRVWLYLCDCAEGDSPRSRILWEDDVPHSGLHPEPRRGCRRCEEIFFDGDGHPKSEVLVAFAGGGDANGDPLPAEMSAAVRTHIRRCGKCTTEFAALQETPVD